MKEVTLPNDYENVSPKQDNLDLRDLSGWGDEWYNSILPENNKINLLFDDWNKEFRGKLRSKLMLVLGYGGSKKSLLGQNIIYKNIISHENRAIYSTMEMGISDILNRFIDMKVEGEKYNASFELEKLNQEFKGEAMNIYKNQIAPSFSDKLLLTQNASMTTEKYDKLLTKCENDKQPVDILLVDGLSMMGGIGSETEKYSENSKELKELSKKWNILIILICHVSKGAKPSDRDLSNLIRSSEKIHDNCDFYVTMSQLEVNGEGKKKDYSKDYGVARLVNKRGSGKTIEIVYQFDQKRLFMEQSGYGVSDFPTHKKMAF